MDLAIVTALSNLGGMGLLSAVLFFLLLRQMALFDKHMTALVGRIDRLEGDMSEIKSALGADNRLRIFPADADPAA